jgi:Ca-activated chloride channel family protein
MPIARLVLILLVLQATFSVRSDLVVVPVVVTDTAGRSVNALTQENFRLYDEGRLQPIARFQHGDVPITLGLAIDYSLSMESNIGALTSAVSAFARARHSSDEMFVLPFNNLLSFEPSGGSPFANNPHDLASALSGRLPMGATALYDALAAGLRRVGAGTRDRKALVVISDGGDNASGQTFADVVSIAHHTDAAIYAIGIGPVENKQDKKNVRVLRELAEKSGGQAYFPSSAHGLEAVLSQVADDLRDQYTLAFIPADLVDKNHVRKIRVTVSASTSRTLHVRARSSYSLNSPSN